MKTKTFDCVEMKHQGAEQLKKKIDRLTNREESAFWSDRTHELTLRLETAKTQKQLPRDKPSPKQSKTHK
jgi:hypothetical protein